MVIHDDNDGSVICVGQASHAWISGQLARHWGNADFDRPEPFDEVCLGAEQHDVGMAEWDLTPGLDAETGRPVSFLDMPLSTHLELWSAAPLKILTQSPYAALIVSMHGHALYARRDTTEPDTDDSVAVRRFVREQEDFQRDLLDHLDEDPERARHNQKLVWALDFLSLAPLVGWVPESVPAPTRLGEAPAELRVESAGQRRVTVDPWPFAEDEIEVRCHGRRLTDRYGGEAELRAALAAAPWLTLRFHLARRAA